VTHETKAQANAANTFIADIHGVAVRRAGERIRLALVTDEVA